METVRRSSFLPASARATRATCSLRSRHARTRACAFPSLASPPRCMCAGAWRTTRAGATPLRSGRPTWKSCCWRTRRHRRRRRGARACSWCKWASRSAAQRTRLALCMWAQTCGSWRPATRAPAARLVLGSCQAAATCAGLRSSRRHTWHVHTTTCFRCRRSTKSRRQPSRRWSRRRAAQGPVAASVMAAAAAAFFCASNATAAYAAWMPPRTPRYGPKKTAAAGTPRRTRRAARPAPRRRWCCGVPTAGRSFASIATLTCMRACTTAPAARCLARRARLDVGAAARTACGAKPASQWLLAPRTGPAPCVHSAQDCLLPRPLGSTSRQRFLDCFPCWLYIATCLW
mmetsp:Transcript_15614/g.46062  ORF Transcript_15614/g.46062 Transcript_15614/m.46062 type:complete len:345 (-) Transcript_15614:194-1228(-)